MPLNKYIKSDFVFSKSLKIKLKVMGFNNRIKSNYDLFLKIKQAREEYKNGTLIEIDPDNIWKSIP